MLAVDKHKTEESTEVTESPVPLNNPSTVTTISEVDTQASTLKKTCTFFKKKGSCKFSESCRFAHIPSDTSKQTQNIPAVSKGKTETEGKRDNSPDQKKESKSESVKEKPQGNCYIFKKTGRCRYGVHCRFLHGKFHDGKSDGKKRPDRQATQKKSESENNHEVERIQTTNDISSVSPKDQKDDGSVKPSGKQMKQRRKLCRYFKEGTCNMADRCRFFHPQDPTELDGNDRTTDDKSSSAVQREVFQRPQSSLTVAEASVENVQKLRDIEVNQLKVKFQGEGKLKIVEEEGKPVIYRIVTSPSDPEWPYDITEFIFDVTFPEDYPKEPFSIRISEEDEVLPDVIIRHISEASQNWVLAKHQTNLVSGKIELIFRPFLRWLDRSIENLFTEGARKYKRCLEAKAAGFEFFPRKEKIEINEDKEDSSGGREKEKIKEEDKVIDGEADKDADKANDENEDDNGDEGEDNSDEEDDSDEEGSNEEDSDEEDSDEEESDESYEEEERNTTKYRQRSLEQTQAVDPQRKGTELRFKGLEMGDGYGTLTIKKLALTIQCERCKHRTDMNTPGGRANMIICPRCQHQFLLTFRPAIMHQFSAILGYLDLSGCLPFDVMVMDCEIQATCLSCDHQKQIKGLQYGQTLTGWCPQCHVKQSLRVDSTRLQRLFASDPISTERLHTVKVQSVVRAKKDPAIQEGKPLPANGTCQHYKKSFRWLRFPCCGKCYPCDQCHDDDSDHIFTFANRMICGFCAKEQAFSPENPCIACRMSMTKGWSSHWEGGQGCRNKVKMNKGDKQKYSGNNKTISKKAKEKKGGHSKKSKATK